MVPEVKWLIEKRFLPFPNKEDEDSALLAVCHNSGNDEQQLVIVQMLLEAHPTLLDLEHAGANRNKALCYAVAAGNCKVVCFLLECYKAIGRRFNGDTLVSSKVNDIATLYVKQCAVEHLDIDDVILPDIAEDSVLHVACQLRDTLQKQLAIVQMLVKDYPKLLVSKAQDGSMPLHDAAATGNDKIVRFLLQCYTAIWLSCNGLDCVSIKSDIIAVDRVDYDPQLLDINEQRFSGHTALHLAVLNQHENVVRTMLDFSREISRILEQEMSNELRTGISNHLMIDFTVVDGTERTVLMQAAEENRHLILDLIFDKSSYFRETVCNVCSDPAISHNTVRGLLTAAVEHGYMETTKVLLKHNQCADMTEALAAAFKYKREDIVALLLFRLVGDCCDLETAEPNEINWQGRNLPHITRQWLIQAAEQLRDMQGITPPVGVDVTLASLSCVTYLDLSQNQLTTVPVEIFFMTEMTTLSLANNKLTYLYDTKAILSCSHLSKEEDPWITAGASRKGILPCQKLSKLIVSKNKLTDLPRELFELPNLQTLFASANMIAKLPDNVWSSHSLSELNLMKNSITRLPGPCGDYMTSMMPTTPPTPSNLHLRVSELAKSKGIRKARSLTDLGNKSCNERENKTLRYVKSDMLRKTGTSSSNIQSNGSDTRSTVSPSSSIDESDEIAEDVLPPDIFTSTSGSGGRQGSYQLQAKQKQLLQTLPAKSLASHHFLSTGSGTPTLVVGDTVPSHEHDSDPSLKHRTPTVGAYNYTVSESIDETDADGEHGTHCKSSSLTVLNVSHNKLMSLPLGFPCLAPNLKRLNISFNKFEAIDPVAMLPQSIENLNAKSNFIQTTLCERRTTPTCLVDDKIPSGGSSQCRHQRHDVLINLGFLQLRNNQLCDMELVQVKEDKDRDGTENRMVIALYPHLHTLELCNNKLVAFPRHICYLKELRVLKVSDNANIKKLSPDLICLNELLTLSLDGLDLVDLPQSEMNKGAKRIINFLRHRQVGAQLYRRMKLMVVGLAKKGKSTLVHRLVNYDSFKRIFLTDSRLREKTTTATVGIEISEIVLKPGKGLYSKEDPITFGIWDFAGHEEYYATHQCFLTHRSIYLVLWNLADGEEGIESLASWLANIQACAPGSPVLIVGTHLDVIERRSDASVHLQMLIGELRRRYKSPSRNSFSSVVGHIEVSLVNKLKNIKVLRTKLFEIACEMRDARGMVQEFSMFV